MGGPGASYHVAIDFGTSSSAIAIRQLGGKDSEGVVMLNPATGEPGIHEKLPSDISFYFSEDEYEDLTSYVDSWAEETKRRRLAEALRRGRHGTARESSRREEAGGRAKELWGSEDSLSGSDVEDRPSAGRVFQGSEKNVEASFFRKENSFLGVQVPADVDRAAYPILIRFRGFKTFLYRNGRISLPDYPRVRGSDSRSYALYSILLAFFGHLRSVIERYFAGRGKTRPDVSYTLTVPTIATSASNLFYKAVFADAFGLEQAKADGIQLINESEAAATFVLSTEFMGRRAARLSTTSLFAVCDFGGGTADFSLMEVVSTNPLVLELSSTSMGRAAGGYHIDAAFLSAMERLFQPHSTCYAEFYTSVMSQWHTWKHTAKHRDEDYRFDLQLDNVLSFYVPMDARGDRGFRSATRKHLNKVKEESIQAIKDAGYELPRIHSHPGMKESLMWSLYQAVSYSAYLFRVRYLDLYPGRKDEIFELEWGEVSDSKHHCEDCIAPLNITIQPRYVVDALYTPPIEQTVACAREFASSAFEEAGRLNKSLVFMLVGGFSTCSRISNAFKAMVKGASSGSVSYEVILAQSPSLAILRGAIRLAEASAQNAAGPTKEVRCGRQTIDVPEDSVTFLRKVPANLFLGLPLTSDMLAVYVNTEEGKLSTMATLAISAEYREYEAAGRFPLSGNITSNIAYRLVRDGTRTRAGKHIAEFSGIAPFSASQETLAFYVYDSRNIFAQNSSIAAAEKDSRMALVSIPAFQKDSGQTVAECSASCFCLDLKKCRYLSGVAFPVITLRVYYDPALRLEALVELPDGGTRSVFCRHVLSRGADAPAIRSGYSHAEDALFQFVCPEKCHCKRKCIHPPLLCEISNQHYECKEVHDYKFPCGHIEPLPCHQVGISSCPHICGKTRPCGHPCAEHENHPGPCSSHYCSVMKTYTCSYCGKPSQYECSRYRTECSHPCKYVFLCGHACEKTCQHVPDGSHPLLCSAKVDRMCEHGKTTCDCSSFRFCKKPCEHACDNPSCPKGRPACKKRCCDDCAPCCRCRCMHTCPTCGKRCLSFTGHPCVFLCGCNGPVPEIFSLLMASVIDETDLMDDDVLIYLPCHRDKVFVYEDLRQFYGTAVEGMDSGQADVCVLACPLCKSELYGVWCLSDLISRVIGKIEARINTMASGKLSQQELVSIYQAMSREGWQNTSIGHFYQCQCGYQYFVGECGGPMQEAQCPQCRRTIGGRNHVVASGARLAAMDFGQGDVNRATGYTKWQ